MGKLYNVKSIELKEKLVIPVIKKRMFSQPSTWDVIRNYFFYKDLQNCC